MRRSSYLAVLTGFVLTLVLGLAGAARADWSGDGKADILAINATTGGLYLYPGDGRRGWLDSNGQQVGADWHQFVPDDGGAPWSPRHYCGRLS